MKFILRETDFDNTYEIDEKYIKAIESNEIKYVKTKKYVIVQIENATQLTSLAESIGELIITHNYSLQHPVLEIYNSWRE